MVHHLDLFMLHENLFHRVPRLGFLFELHKSLICGYLELQEFQDLEFLVPYVNIHCNLCFWIIRLCKTRNIKEDYVMGEKKTFILGFL